MFVATLTAKHIITGENETGVGVNEKVTAGPHKIHPFIIYLTATLH